MNKLLRFDDAYYIHFITTKTFRNILYFINNESRLILIKNIKKYRKKYKFKLLGYCIMPDHLHILIQEDLKLANDIKPPASRGGGEKNLCANDIKPPASRKKQTHRLGDGFTPSPLQQIIHDIKGKTAIDIRNILKIKNKIWQKSFYDFPIYSDRKFEEKLNYIHNNPLKAGLVDNLDNYLWSSYQNFYLNNNSLTNINYLND